MAEVPRQVQLARLYRTLKILVVDDFENFRLSIKQMLRSFGIEHIHVAGNGIDAVEKFNHDSYDIVLCDYNLGEGKTGQQILEELRFTRVLKHTSLFIMVTAETAKDMVMGALEYLPDGYLTKPITKTVLQQRLDALIDQRQALMPINEALDQEDHQAIIELCLKELSGDTKYRNWCYRTLAKTYFAEKEYDKAKRIYEDVLTKRDISWARLGFAKVAMAKGDYTTAITNFKQILNQNPNIVEAHDCLADTYQQMGKMKDAQASLEKAVSISPFAILRQQKLADLCLKNKDVNKACEAFRNTVKLGNNSIHESPQSYLQLSRCLSDLAEGDTSREGKKLAQEAQKTLEKVSKKFKDDKEVKLQSLLIQSRVHKGQNETAKAEATLEKAADAIDMDYEEQSPETSLELAKSLYAAGKTDKAEKLLCDLARDNAKNKDVIASIEELLDEPVSLKQKVKARKLNKKGIQLFEQGSLDEAIAVFSEALEVSPKHPALNLNLVQVSLKSLDAGNPDQTVVAKCRAALENVKHIPPQHNQYKRYQHLVKKVDALPGPQSQYSS